MRWTKSCTAVLAFGLLPMAANAQQVAGQVLWLSGEVASISAEGVTRPLAKGDALHEGDTVRTGAGGYAQLLMKDEALLALRPESSLSLTNYHYTGRQDGSERAVYNLIRGGFRSITGAIGANNKDNFLIRTGNVLVGIRGTDHETFVVPDAGTYNRVTLGGTYLQSAEGRVDLAPGQIGFASLTAPPSLLQRTPEFMQLSALQGPDSGPAVRGAAPGDERRLEAPMGAPFNDGEIAHGKRTLPEHVVLPLLPAQALGDNSRTTGWGKGGRCGGPCADIVGGVAKGVGKGNAP